jgi:hypothetical protein
VPLLLAAAGDARAQLFRAPVTCTSCISDYYYVDQGFGGDWNCGNSSYSGHEGSDYSLRNGNFAIDNDNEVVAMAAGMVVHAEDGYYDRCTQCGGANCGTGVGFGFANQVIINHGPHRTIYGHMKMGSIAVQEGDTVECGQVIGFIGSSGCSTGAHLHIEPSLAANFGMGNYQAIDPYEGECSPTESSLFTDQGAYRTLPNAACDDEPPVPTCPADTYDVWTCDTAAKARRRCVNGMVMDETCMWGCTVMPVGEDDLCAMPPDADGDGSRADVDCNDASAAVHPGAVEVCGDGIDQECSGGDMACPQPPAGGMSGAMPPPSGAGGTAALTSGAGGQAVPPLGQGGMLAPPLAQAGTFGAGGTGITVPSRAARAPADEGCAVSAPRNGPRDGTQTLLLVALGLFARVLHRHRALRKR